MSNPILINEIMVLLYQFRQIPWRPKQIGKFLNSHWSDVKSTIEILEKNGYVFKDSDGSYDLTFDGEMEVETTIKNPTIHVNDTSFRNEVLTGMTERKGKRWKITARSGIKNPALNRRTRLDLDEDAKEPICEQYVYSGEIAKALGLDRTRFVKMYESGMIRTCNRGEPHIGIFDRNGNYWQSYCRECRKEIKKNGE